jgi:RHS repeat-associated protein
MEHILYPNNNAITKIFQRDGLGRLTDICEVTAVTQANGAVPASCGLDIAGTGFHSTNTYDALGNVVYMGSGSVRTFVYDGLSRPTTTTYPESGTTTYVYDTGTAGDLYQRIAPAPNQTGSTTVTSTYTHDALHRLTGISYSDGTTPAITYNYDQSSVWSHTLTNPKGRMTSAAIGSGEITSVFGYDPMGRVALHGQCTPLNCGTTNFFASYTYNYIGEPQGGTDYLGITWANTYNAIGQLSEVTTNWLSPTQSGTIASGITYNALGQPVSDTLGDGKNEGWNYNVDGHVTTFSGGSYPGYNFGFSPSSLTWTGDLLTSSSDNVNGSWTYTYDDFARLKSASGSQDFVYGYDEYSNRWSTMTGTQQYSFNGVNNHITTNGFAYDAAGNVTNDSIHSYTYDAEGRLKAVDSGNTAKYNYDAFGNRTMQFSTTPSVYNEYVVDLSGRAITAIQPGTTNVYTAEVFAGGRHWVTDNGSALFLGTDWLGTTRALTELNGTFAQLYTSLPWGDGLSSGGSSFDTTSQYTGKEYDPESGLYHFPARQYAPVQGRWLTPDPAGISAMSLDSPQSWNRYAYVLNTTELCRPGRLGLCVPE